MGAMGARHISIAGHLHKSSSRQAHDFKRLPAAIDKHHHHRHYARQSMMNHSPLAPTNSLVSPMLTDLYQLTMYV